MGKRGFRFEEKGKKEMKKFTKKLEIELKKKCKKAGIKIIDLRKNNFRKKPITNTSFEF